MKFLFFIHCFYTQKKYKNMAYPYHCDTDSSDRHIFHAEKPIAITTVTILIIFSFVLSVMALSCTKLSRCFL